MFVNEHFLLCMLNVVGDVFGCIRHEPRERWARCTVECARTSLFWDSVVSWTERGQRRQRQQFTGQQLHYWHHCSEGVPCLRAFLNLTIVSLLLQWVDTSMCRVTKEASSLVWLFDRVFLTDGANWSDFGHKGWLNRSKALAAITLLLTCCYRDEVWLWHLECHHPGKIALLLHKMFFPSGWHIWASKNIQILSVFYHLFFFVTVVYWFLSHSCSRLCDWGYTVFVLCSRWQWLVHAGVMRQTPDHVLVHRWQHRWCRTLRGSVTRSDICCAWLY